MNGPHYNDVIITTMASQITSLTVVYPTVYSDADQRKHQSSASLAFVWGIHRDRWIPRTKGQLRGKCFHLMTSSCTHLRSVHVYFEMTLMNMKLLDASDSGMRHHVCGIFSSILLLLCKNANWIWSCVGTYVCRRRSPISPLYVSPL